MSEEKEIWKPIIGFEKTHELNQYGEIRRIERKTWNGKCFIVNKGKKLKWQKRPDRYIVVNVSVDNKLTQFRQHRLVWEYHNETVIPKHLEINHIDGDPSNNKASNLEAITRKENHWHKNNVLGNHIRGERCPTSKLKNKQVLKIKKLLMSKKYTQKKIAEMFCISQTQVSKINLGKQWFCI